MEIEAIIGPFLIVFSLGMLITSIVSYKKSKNLKLIFVSIAFLIFLIKGILISLLLFNQNITTIVSISSFGILDLFVLISVPENYSSIPRVFRNLFNLFESVT